MKLYYVGEGDASVGIEKENLYIHHYPYIY